MPLFGRCRYLEALGLAATPMLSHGHQFRDALAAAEGINPGLIVLGSEGRSTVRELLTDSTFETVIRLSRQPVLAVPCEEIT